MCVHVANLGEIMAEGGQCLSMGMTMVYVSLAAIDGCIAIAAGIQVPLPNIFLGFFSILKPQLV